MYPRSSSRRPMIPPPDYSGVLFDGTSDASDQQEKPSGELPAPADEAAGGKTSAENNAEQPEKTAQRRKQEPDQNVTLPLPAPEVNGIDDCLPRYPLPRRPFSQYYNRRRKKYTLIDDTPSIDKPAQTVIRNPLMGLLANAGFDDLLLAALIFMMLESGSDPITVLLLGLLLI